MALLLSKKIFLDTLSEYRHCQDFLCFVLANSSGFGVPLDLHKSLLACSCTTKRFWLPLISDAP